MHCTLLQKPFTLVLELLVRHMERILLPLNAQMRYLEWPEELLAAFHQLLSSMSSTSLHHSTVDETSRLNAMERDVLRMLRHSWLLVLYARSSYQQDFFANY